MDFVAMDKYLTISYELNCDGEIIESGNVDHVPAVPPHAEGTIRLNFEIPARGRSYLKLIYQLREATELLPAGFVLGFDEIALEATADGRNQKALERENWEMGCGQICERWQKALFYRVWRHSEMDKSLCGS